MLPFQQQNGNLFNKTLLLLLQRTTYLYKSLLREKLFIKHYCFAIRSYYEEELYKRLYLTGAATPTLYGFPKLHKVGMPLRPIVSSINPGKCTDAQRVHLEVLKDNMELSRILFAPHTCSTSSAGETSAGARPRSRPRPTSTPLFTNVPGAPGNVSNQYDSPSSAIIRAGKNRFLCDICGLEKTKTSELLDHLSVKHQLGSPIVCKE